MERSGLDTQSRADRRQAERRMELSEVLAQLAASYDAQARLNRNTDERAWSRSRKLIKKLETKVVTLARPRRWRLHDLKTGGIRSLDAVGVSLRDGKLTYQDQSWPANWSFAIVTPSATAGTRLLSIGRVVLRSAVPLRQRAEPGRWSIKVSVEDLPAALILAASINVASRLRAATFPVGTYF